MVEQVLEPLSPWPSYLCILFHIESFREVTWSRRRRRWRKLFVPGDSHESTCPVGCDKNSVRPLLCSSFGAVDPRPFLVRFGGDLASQQLFQGIIGDGGVVTSAIMGYSPSLALRMVMVDESADCIAGVKEQAAAENP